MPVQGQPNPFRAAFTWTGAVTDAHPWISPLSAAVGTAASAVLLAGPETPGVWAIAGTVVMIGAATFPEIAASAWRRAEEKASGNAVVEAHLYLKNALKPLVDLVGDLAQRREQPETALAKAVSHAAYACLLTMEDRLNIRAMVFQVNTEATEMTCVSRAGRADASRGFDRTTTRGKDAFRVLELGETAHVEDLTAARVNHRRAWSGTGASYKTFVTVPITVGDAGYGLLTIDSPHARTFSQTNILYLELVAGLLGAVFAEAQRQTAEGV